MRNRVPGISPANITPPGETTVTPRRSDKGRQPKNRAAARANHHTKPKHRRGNPRSGLCRRKMRKKIKRDKGGPSHEKCLSGTSQIRVRPALYSKRISEPTKHHVATSSSQPAHQLSLHHAPEAGGAVQMRGTIRQSLRENIRRSSARGFGSPHKCSRPAQR